MNITAKTKKSFLKRIKVTKKGKVLSRKPGKNHFQAKKRRSEQLTGKRLQDFKINSKTLGKYVS